MRKKLFAKTKVLMFRQLTSAFVFFPFGTSPVFVAIQVSLYRTWLEPSKTGFLATYIKQMHIHVLYRHDLNVGE